MKVRAWVYQPLDGLLPIYRIALWAIDEARGGDAAIAATRRVRFIDALATWWRFSRYLAWACDLERLVARATAASAMWAIRKTNRSRDERLAADLIDMAKRYARRPEELWCYLDADDIYLDPSGPHAPK